MHLDIQHIRLDPTQMDSLFTPLVRSLVIKMIKTKLKHTGMCRRKTFLVRLALSSMLIANLTCVLLMLLFLLLLPAANYI